MEAYTKDRIDGAFKGWTGKGVYKFVNGQIWVQTKYKYKHNSKHSYHPHAQIWIDGSRFFLEVEGMADKIEVRRGTIDDLKEA